jgi:hypothetical protein
MHKVRAVLLGATIIAAAFGGRYVGQVNERYDTGTAIIHSCANYGEFAYLSRDHRLVRLKCAAPDGAKFKRVNGELVIEYDRVPENPRIVRL